MQNYVQLNKQLTDLGSLIVIELIRIQLASYSEVVNR